MAVMLIKGVVYLVCGIVLVMTAELPRWATYAVGCWCGANAMGYLVGWAMARVEVLKAQTEKDASTRAVILDFMTRRHPDGPTTH
jgi:bacteriorhodopsin